LAEIIDINERTSSKELALPANVKDAYEQFAALKRLPEFYKGAATLDFLSCQICCLPTFKEATNREGDESCRVRVVGENICQACGGILSHPHLGPLADFVVRALTGHELKFHGLRLDLIGANKKNLTL
jgi:hypothetical protein